jgi:hypothetical protein
MSLQFHSQSGYFSALAGRRLAWAVAAVLVACSTRDRITFAGPNQGDGRGPVTTVLHPAVTDTTVVEGDLFILNGYSLDPDGVDTVYFDVSGSLQSFPPLLGEGDDSVPFALQFSTLNNSGGTIIVRTFAVDAFGVMGTTALRQIHIQ